MAPIRPTSPRSRAASSMGRCACQATRLWICIRSTRPPYQLTARESCAAPSAAEGVQTLSATRTCSRRPPSAPDSSRSAAPYMGEVSMTRMPAAMAASTSSPVPSGRGGGLQPPPGAQPDHRHADPARAQAPVLQSRHLRPAGSPVRSCPHTIRGQPAGFTDTVILPPSGGARAGASVRAGLRHPTVARVAANSRRIT